MQELLRAYCLQMTNRQPVTTVAVDAYEVADAMLKIRERPARSAWTWKSYPSQYEQLLTL